MAASFHTIRHPNLAPVWWRNDRSLHDMLTSNSNQHHLFNISFPATPSPLRWWKVTSSPHRGKLSMQHPYTNGKGRRSGRQRLQMPARRRVDVRVNGGVVLRSPHTVRSAVWCCLCNAGTATGPTSVVSTWWLRLITNWRDYCCEVTSFTCTQIRDTPPPAVGWGGAIIDFWRDSTCLYRCNFTHIYTLCIDVIGRCIDVIDRCSSWRTPCWGVTQTAYGIDWKRAQ